MVITKKPNRLFYTVEETAKGINDGSISLDSEIQRETKQWNKEMKEKLICSIFENVAIPEMISNRDNNDVLVILDGKQRLSTIKEYFNDEFVVSSKYIDNSLAESVANKKYSELSVDTSNRFKNGQIWISTYTNLPIEEQEELFVRYNNEVPLKSSNKYRVIGGVHLRELENKILDMDLFRYHIILTASQKRKQKQNACIEFSFGLITGQVTNFGANAMKNFVRHYRDNYNIDFYKEKEELLLKSFKVLDEIVDDKIFMKKGVDITSHIPEMVYVISTCVGKPEEEKLVKDRLNIFIKKRNYEKDKFRQLSGNNATTSSDKIINKINYFNKSIGKDMIEEMPRLDIS